MQNNKLELLRNLSYQPDIDTYKQLVESNKYLAELKGKTETIPNAQILINTITLQEAKDSSEIENIVTTHDDLFKSDPALTKILDPAAKEVYRYAEALRNGYEIVDKKKLLTLNDIIVIQNTLKKNDAGIRRTPGTRLENDRTGEVVYIPPQDYDEIITLMKDLEEFINNNEASDLDPLIKMAVIHHRFESIHPFTDGNGRTGRVINVLYLVLQGLLDLPVLYLSRYIIRNKDKYYQLLQEVRETNNWQDWILYILKGIEVTSRQTIKIIDELIEIMREYKHGIRKDCPKIYSQDLLNNIFKHPYTKIRFIEDDLKVSRATATTYLNKLVTAGYLKKMRLGRDNYYINPKLFELFVNTPSFRD